MIKIMVINFAIVSLRVLFALIVYPTYPCIIFERLSVIINLIFLVYFYVPLKPKSTIDILCVNQPIKFNIMTFLKYYNLMRAVFIKILTLKLYFI